MRCDRNSMLISKYVGSSFDIVKEVVDNMPAIKNASSIIDGDNLLISKDVFNRNLVVYAVGNTYAKYQENGNTFTPLIAYNGNFYLPTSDIGNISYEFTAGNVVDNGDETITVNTDQGNLILSKYLAKAVNQSEANQVTDLFTEAPIPYAAGINVSNARVIVSYNNENYLPKNPFHPFTTTQAFDSSKWELDKRVTKDQLANIISSGLVVREEPLIWKVGTDPAQAPYDYSELADALIAATLLSVGNKNDGLRPIRISIPVGTHEFTKTVRLRGANLLHVQIWADYAAVIKCPIGTSGVFFQAINCMIGDIVGTKLYPPTGHTISTDPAVSCQPWWTDTPPPWGSETVLTYFSFAQCFIGRMTGIGFNGDSTGVMLGLGIDTQGTVIGNFDDIEANKFREIGSFYLGSLIGTDLTGIRGTDIYVGGRCHEASFRPRKVDLTGAINPATNKGYAGGAVWDCFRGDLSMFSGTVTNFNYKYVLSDADMLDRLTSVNVDQTFWFINDGNTISTTERYLPTADILSYNSILSVYDASKPRMAQFNYTGNADPQQVVLTSEIAPNISKVIIRKESDLGEITCLRGQTATLGGANAVFINDNNIVTVYGAMNTDGQTYTLIYE